MLLGCTGTFLKHRQDLMIYSCEKRQHGSVFSLNQELTYLLKSMLTDRNLGIQRERGKNTYLSFFAVDDFFVVSISENPGTVGKKRK